MDRLWTPWRMEYIRDLHKERDCIFCELPALDPANDPESLIVARGQYAFVLLNKFPYNTGHLLVSPYRHTARFEDLGTEEHAEMSAWVSQCIRALESAYRPQGYNMGVNQGSAAGAGIAEHLHSHVVPRWAGDTNYMTTVGGTKVLPETLEETYAKLRPLVAS